MINYSFHLNQSAVIHVSEWGERKEEKRWREEKRKRKKDRRRITGTQS